jgi:hypothetical protein
MIPNIHIHERLMFECHQERQREMAQQRLGAGLLRQRPGVARRLVAGVGTTLFLALRPRLRRLESSGKKVVYEHNSVQ